MKEESKIEAIPFIQVDTETNEYTINESCFEFLKDLEGPLGVISVVGMYRTGKSYLLNRMLLNQQNGFGVGPTIHACTKGLWIWPKPIAGFTPEGDPINILVVDTEGLGALDEDSNHDTKIFSLALLMSSFFIYNSVGSIDESALQNLSLVINLTKHIRLKAQGSDDIDPEEYARYFPAFMWVVRDFTLQLMDEDGEPISSKDYFEKSLDPQKGFSDSIEQKNRIRRLLKSFFADRDCCTMVRPLTKEEDLQNLENMKLEELRPEFVEQVMQLRRKIINRMKPKMLNGKNLNGEMLCNLAQTYIAAINKGVVPNIENAWTYICKNECTKAFHEALERFDMTLKELAYSKIPMEEMELKQCHKEAREIAISEFNGKAVGQISSDYMKDLRSKLKQKYVTIKAENEKECKKACQGFLNVNYMGLEKQMKSGEFQSFEEYAKELKSFQLYFLEQGPQGPDRKSIMLDFCQRAMNEAADYFLKKISSDFEIQKVLTQDEIKKLESRVTELKDEYRKDCETLSFKVKSLEVVKSELTAKEEGLKDSLENLTLEKQATENALRGQLEDERKSAQKLTTEMREKLTQEQEKAKEADYKLISSESEFEKQKALFEQKILQLEKTLDDAKRKEKDYINEANNSKKSQDKQIKEVIDKHEVALRQAQEKIETTREKLLEMEGKLSEAEQKYEMTMAEQAEEKESSLSKFSEYEKVVTELRAQTDSVTKKAKEDMRQFEAKFDQEKLALKKRISELEVEGKSMEEQYKGYKAKMDKNEAMMQQKLQFYELQLNDTKAKLEETKQAHETAIRNLEITAKNEARKAEADKKIEELKAKYQSEIKELEDGLKRENTSLNAQVDQLTEKCNDLELRLKLVQTDFEKEKTALNEQIESLQSTTSKMNNQNKSLEQQKVKLMEESEKHYKEVIANLERQMEENSKRSQQEIHDLQTQSEESLTQLRNFYELEKERLENRVTEEKSKVEKRYVQQLEEIEAKIKEEQQLHAEDVEMLQNDLKECEAQHQAIIAQLEQENTLLGQKLETQEVQLKEAKEQASKLHSINSKALEQQLSNFAEERKDLLAKIDNFTKEATVKEKEVTILENKVEALKAEIERKEKSFEEWKKEKSEERDSLATMVESLKAKNQEISDEYMQKKLDFNKESALAIQQAEYLNSKIKELQVQNEELMGKSEEKLQAQKAEFAVQLRDVIEKANVDKEAAEQKYEQKRKVLKELELDINKQTAKFEREKTSILDKYNALETKKQEIEKAHEDEVAELNGQIAQLKESIKTGQNGSAAENESLRKHQAELEKELLELQTNYEKDKGLWQGKWQFLEQQRDQYKSDLADSQKKFDTMLEELHKREMTDKEKYETTKNSALATIEQKMKEQMKELNETNQQKCQELTTKNKQLETELKELKEKIQFDYKGKIAEQGSLERKVSDLTDTQEKLMAELELVKADRDRKILDYQKQLEKDKETYKAKLQDTETRLKESENKRNKSMLDHEKEKTCWAIEKDKFLTQKSEAQLTIEKLDKKRESLLLENEKLKAQRTRKPTYGSGAMGGANYPMRYSAMKFKENYAKFAGTEDKQDQLETGSNSSSNVKSSNGSIVKTPLGKNDGDNSTTEVSVHTVPTDTAT